MWKLGDFFEKSIITSTKKNIWKPGGNAGEYTPSMRYRKAAHRGEAMRMLSAIRTCHTAKLFNFECRPLNRTGSKNNLTLLSISHGVPRCRFNGPHGAPPWVDRRNGRRTVPASPYSWWRSANATIGPIIGAPSLLRRVNWWLQVGPYAAKRGTLSRLNFAAFYGTENWRGDEELCKARFRAHYDYVRTLVPAERLLELDVKEGWAPLCRFSGKKIPDEPFPRLFDTATFKSSTPACWNLDITLLTTRIIPVEPIFLSDQALCPLARPE
ncbi:hypothetical protein C8F04DRAFT_1345101 [Mycena alexandri]|uniref:Uncharacterized protein n=1 Tax=Mycena alexandri TaxID=1745969 RepID=A0AAD6SWG9_9AGAR|nr:hypothetical protein C8F04DRAFT_1345101 [Mycena alexandri]